jgi:Kef-type K+ transport system membrane component KefB
VKKNIPEFSFQFIQLSSIFGAQVMGVTNSKKRTQSRIEKVVALMYPVYFVDEVVEEGGKSHFGPLL